MLNTEILFFSDSDNDITGRKILFEDVKSKGMEQQIKFDGTPFIILGEKIYECQFGKDRHAARKEKNKAAMNKVNFVDLSLDAY